MLNAWSLEICHNSMLLRSLLLENLEACKIQLPKKVNLGGVLDIPKSNKVDGGLACNSNLL